MIGGASYDVITALVLITNQELFTQTSYSQVHTPLVVGILLDRATILGYPILTSTQNTPTVYFV